VAARRHHEFASHPGRERLGAAELTGGAWWLVWILAQKYVFEEEHALAAAPRLVVFGNDAQKAEFLPKILSSEHVWC
jgi:alkylation response protein AidB-like acyl-CoA dehydrogenase